MTEYSQLVREHFDKLRKLNDEKHRIELEISYVKQLLKAVTNLMPDKERAPLLYELGEIVMDQVGLTSMIKKMLTKGKFLSPADIKAALEADGYDFTNYKSNPLSSIHAVIKRFRPSQLETQSWTDGTTRYRLKLKKGSK